MRTLNVWAGTTPVGRFLENDSGISFEYDSASSPQISASLPMDGGHGPLAARNFLLNLLPERPGTRLAMREALGAKSADPFDLLDSVDTVGGFTYTLGDRPPKLAQFPLIPMGELDIEAKIAECSTGCPLSPCPGMRFSLAGYQGKFTLALIGSSWYSPSALTPSTHIIKPEAPGVRSVCIIESLTMDLAEACHIRAPRHGMIAAGQSTAYCVERFDRKGIGSSNCKRLHVEDLAQALGISPAEKYDPTLEEVVTLLRHVDPSVEICYEWLGQYMFNAYSGNADGHAKNYSIVHEGDKTRLSPLYDAVMTSAWPEYDRGTGLNINDTVFFPEYLTASAWKEVSRHLSLDEDRVVSMARTIAGDIRESLPELSKALPEDIRTSVLEGAMAATAGIMDPDFAIGKSFVPVYEPVYKGEPARLDTVEPDADAHVPTTLELKQKLANMTPGRLDNSGNLRMTKKGKP